MFVIQHFLWSILNITNGTVSYANKDVISVILHFHV